MADESQLTRRQLFRLTVFGSVGLAGAAALGGAAAASRAAPARAAGGPPGGPLVAAGHDAVHVAQMPGHEVDVITARRNVPPVTWRVRDPMQYLTAFDRGHVRRLADGRTLREVTLVAQDREIEVARGVRFAAWTYNGTVPGPTIRATEGDLVRVHFVNDGTHPHTIHFHGFHAANMDGVREVVAPGGSFTYEFTAEPFGLHLYHCHTVPIKRHIHKGLYGVFIVDPKQGRPPARELVMMMNGFDTNLDGENEFYTVNGLPNYYVEHPIPLRRGELVRVYLVNITEFDLLNSMHTHATFFNLYRTGTSLTPHEFTDTVILGQGERAILEFRYQHTGKFMFHAHQSEFAELGWQGFFDVRDGDV